jgi:hypothetical protein
LPDKEQFQLFTASHPFETWANIISFLSNSENVFFSPLRNLCPNQFMCAF